jgi:ribonuclease P protein component
VGGAVVRNRVKRLIREAFWALADGLPVDHDYVVVARADAAEMAERDGLEAFREDLRSLWEQLGVAGSSGTEERSS